jgi:hypothetical protein
MEVYVEPELEAGLAQQLDALHAAQTAPFLELVSDYAACLQHNRELEVRQDIHVCTPQPTMLMALS